MEGVDVSVIIIIIISEYLYLINKVAFLNIFLVEVCILMSALLVKKEIH